MKILMTWCKKCQNTTEHKKVRTATGEAFVCKKCKSSRDVHQDGQVRDPFGPRGRGF